MRFTPQPTGYTSVGGDTSAGPLRAVIMAIALVLSSLAGVTEARIPTPRIKPLAPSNSQILSKKDADLFEKGVKAARRREWATVKIRTAQA